MKTLTKEDLMKNLAVLLDTQLNERLSPRSTELKSVRNEVSEKLEVLASKTADLQERSLRKDMRSWRENMKYRQKR